MQTRLVLSALLFLSLMPGIAQQLEWALPFANDDYCRMYGVDADAAGNIYVAGEYGGSGDLDPGSGTVNVTAQGFNDLMAMKFDASGALQWSYLVGGSSDEREWCTGIVADDAGNSWLCGGYAGVVDFDPGPGVLQQAGSSTQAAFVVKLDPGGQPQWVKSFGVGGASRVSSIARDASGNVYVGGFLTGGGAFPRATDTLLVPDAAGQHAFICKMNSAGAAIWVYLFECTVSGTVTGMDVDPSGAVHFAGLFTGEADLDQGAILFTGAGQQDALMGKLNADGSLAWVRAIGGTGFDVAYDVAADAAGGQVSTGYFASTVDLDPGSGEQVVTSAVGSDAFMIKLDADGDTQWLRTLSTPGGDAGQGITFDAAGRLYLSGYFGGDMELEPGSSESLLTNAGSRDQFIAVFDPDGEPITGWSMGGSSTDLARTIDVDAAGTKVYTVGFFNGSADFDPSAGSTLLQANADDAGVVARYTMTTGTGITDGPGTQPLHVYPNPTSGALVVDPLFNSGPVELRVLDAHGRVMQRTVHTSTGPCRLVIDGAPGLRTIELRFADGAIQRCRVMKE